MHWHTPSLDVAVNQAMITQYVALILSEGYYDKVRAFDQLGHSRGTIGEDTLDNGND